MATDLTGLSAEELLEPVLPPDTIWPKTRDELLRRLREGEALRKDLERATELLRNLNLTPLYEFSAESGTRQLACKEWPKQYRDVHDFLAALTPEGETDD